MRITVQQLRYILKIAEAGSLTKAADDLHVSQAALSNTISQLESNVGFKLFVRNKKGAMPTSRGIEFLGYARRAVQGMDLLETHFGCAKDPNLSFRVVGSNFAFAEYILGDFAKLPEFEKYEFRYDVTPLPETIKRLNSGAADLGLIHTMDDTEISIFKLLANAGLGFHKICERQPYALMDPSHPLANRESLTPADLTPYPKYLFDQYLHLTSSAADNNPDRASVEYYNGIKVYDSSVSIPNLVKCIADVNGYSIWGNVMVQEMIDFGVRAIPIETEERIRIGYVAPRDAALSALEERYIDDIRNFVERSNAGL